MRLGRVYVEIGYLVDLDNKDMVEHATEAIYEDVRQLARDGEEFDLAVNTKEAPSAKEGDIPSFLTEDYLG